MKKNATPIRVVVSSVEELILTTLEELAEVLENEEKPPIFLEGEEVMNTLLGLGSNGSSGGEGNKGGGGIDELTYSDAKPSDSEEEEDHEEEEDMAKQNLEWMTQGPLTLCGALYKVPRNIDILLIKYDLDRGMKVEDDVDTFYLHMQTLEVRYDDVAVDCFHVPWMAEQLYGTATFLSTPFITGGCSKEFSLKNLLMTKPPPCY